MPHNKQVMTSGRQVDYGMGLLGTAVALIGAGGAALLARDLPAPSSQRHGRACHPRLVWGTEDVDARNKSGHDGAVSVKAARRLNRAAGTLAFSVLADSAVEHYRGSFFNRAMYAPLAVSLLTLAVSAHGVADQRRAAHLLRDLIYSAAAMTGAIGTGLHIYNVAFRRGRISWNNLFYGAPLGAPSAILLSGLLGFMAERIRGAKPGRPPTFMGLPAGRVAAGITAAGLLGTAAEAGLLHFRGAYHNPFMLVPVTIPPAAAIIMAEMAVGKKARNRAFSRWWLRLTAAIGFAGVGFHAYGVHRNMGGWRNWRQNVLNGPPLPAPPSFAGLALAGLAALGLIEEQRDA